jgi:hypothetical protein
MYLNGVYDADLVVDFDGNTVLHWACLLGRVKLAKFLLKRGSNQKKTNQQRQTPLMLLVMKNAAYESMVFHEFLELLKDSIYEEDSAGHTVLHHIVMRLEDDESYYIARYYLDELLRFVTALESEKNNALQRVQTRNHSQQSHYEPLIDMVDNEQRTALYFSCMFQDKYAVQLLLNTGASYIEDDERASVFEISRDYKPILLLLMLQKDRDGLISDWELVHLRDLLLSSGKDQGDDTQYEKEVSLIVPSVSSDMNDDFDSHDLSFEELVVFFFTTKS